MTQKLRNISLIVILSIFFNLGIVSSAKAQSDGADGLLPFGGQITVMMPCTCSAPNFWLYLVPFHPISPFVGGPLVYKPGITRLYDNYTVLISSWLLGKYRPGMQSCQMTVGVGCVILPSFGDIEFTGTSRLF